MAYPARTPPMASASAPTTKPAPGPNRTAASTTGRLPRLKRRKPVEMLSTRLNTMLMATSRAQKVRVRRECEGLFGFISVPPFLNPDAGGQQNGPPPCDKPHKGGP